MAAYICQTEITSIFKGIETRKGIRACYLYTFCDYVIIDSCIFRDWYPNGSTGGLKIEGNDNFPDNLNCTNMNIKNSEL